MEAADDLLAQLEERISADTDAARALGEYLSTDESTVIPIFWNWLLETMRSAYGLGVSDPQRSRNYIDCTVATSLVPIDEMLSVIYPGDQESRANAIVALASLVDAEIDWSERNAGKLPSPGLFHGQRIHRDEHRHVIPIRNYWRPPLDTTAGVHAVLARAATLVDLVSAYHEQLVEEACHRFEVHLEGLGRHRDPIVRRTAGRVRESCLLAREQRLDLQAASVHINPDAVRALLREHRPLFVNQWELGLGRDDSSVVVLGAEHAYELNQDMDLVNFCTESIGSGVVWLCGGRKDVTRALSGGVVTEARPFHIHPNDHYRKGSSHTWGRLALALGHPGAHEPHSVPGLGDHCYQIELSAHPSQRNTGSQPPTPERRAFLKRVMEQMRETARVLLIHGSRSSNEHEAARFELAGTFLGIPSEAALNQPHELSRPGSPISVADVDGRRVIKTRSLSQSSGEFLSRIAELVQEVA
jgi:hypothetical protein